MPAMRQVLTAVAVPLVGLALAGTALAGHATATKLTVSFDDKKLALSPSGLEAGTTTIVVVNHGKRVHSLAIEGPGVKGVHTPRLAPGKSARDVPTSLASGMGGRVRMMAATTGSISCGASGAGLSTFCGW